MLFFLSIIAIIIASVITVSVNIKKKETSTTETPIEVPEVKATKPSIHEEIAKVVEEIKAQKPISDVVKKPKAKKSPKMDANPKTTSKKPTTKK